MHLDTKVEIHCNTVRGFTLLMKPCYFVEPNLCTKTSIELVRNSIERGLKILQLSFFNFSPNSDQFRPTPLSTMMTSSGMSIWIPYQYFGHYTFIVAPIGMIQNSRKGAKFPATYPLGMKFSLNFIQLG